MRIHDKWQRPVPLADRHRKTHLRKKNSQPHVHSHRQDGGNRGARRLFIAQKAPALSGLRTSSLHPSFHVSAVHCCSVSAHFGLPEALKRNTHLDTAVQFCWIRLGNLWLNYQCFTWMTISPWLSVQGETWTMTLFFDSKDGHQKMFWSLTHCHVPISKVDVWSTLYRVILEPHRPLRAPLHTYPHTHTHKGSIEINCYA